MALPLIAPALWSLLRGVASIAGRRLIQRSLGRKALAARVNTASKVSKNKTLDDIMRPEYDKFLKLKKSNKKLSFDQFKNQKLSSGDPKYDRINRLFSKRDIKTQKAQADLPLLRQKLKDLDKQVDRYDLIGNKIRKGTIAATAAGSLGALLYNTYKEDTSTKPKKGVNTSPYLTAEQKKKFQAEMDAINNAPKLQKQLEKYKPEKSSTIAPTLAALMASDMPVAAKKEIMEKLSPIVMGEIGEYATNRASDSTNATKMAIAQQKNEAHLQGIALKEALTSKREENKSTWQREKYDKDNPLKTMSAGDPRAIARYLVTMQGVAEKGGYKAVEEDDVDEFMTPFLAFVSSHGLSAEDANNLIPAAMQRNFWDFGRKMDTELNPSYIAANRHNAALDSEGNIHGLNTDSFTLAKMLEDRNAALVGDGSGVVYPYYSGDNEELSGW